MTVQERFAQDWGMPLREVGQLRHLALRAGKVNEHICNGDPHSNSENPADKNANAKLWAINLDAITGELCELAERYGFTEVVFTGLGPTLKRGDQFVEVPY